MLRMNIYPICYFPPIPWFSAAIQENTLLLEVHQHYRKQQFTSRTWIRASNRTLPLTVPVGKRGAKIPIKDKRISYSEKWPHQHWQSLIAAYANSPYFEFYREDLEAFFQQEFTFLPDLLLASLELTKGILQADFKVMLTEEYLLSEAYEADFRNSFDPSLQQLPDWFGAREYPQVFEGFVPGLSILDLVFNLGPESRLYLLESAPRQ